MTVTGKRIPEHILLVLIVGVNCHFESNNKTIYDLPTNQMNIIVSVCSVCVCGGGGRGIV